MWLSTRENRSASEEDNWTELSQHENLYATFVDYELKNWNRETWTWSGDLPGPALTILHQHAVQGRVLCFIKVLNLLHVPLENCLLFLYENILLWYSRWSLLLKCFISGEMG